MPSSAQNPKSNSRALKVWFTDEHICLKLSDGREIKTPLEFYPRLKKASDQDRKAFELDSSGTSIHWPKLDEDLTVEGIVLGRSALI